ncbi:ribosome maturation factor RimM [Congregibacter sp.]|uniref:ribosome maturation factor RimM n=1 Tax=Congregibacter sp. TaxID=2744308 RepID=UPI00385DD365
MNTPEDQMLLAGRISGVYGIKGWVKLQIFTDPPENFFAFRSHLIKGRRNAEAIELADGRIQGKAWVARVVGVDNRTDAELLQGTEIWVPRSELPVLDSDEYYWHQLQGLQVWSEHEGQKLLLGEIDHLLETGANDVLVLRPCEGSADERERLIPYLPDTVILSVELENGTMTVDWHPED